MALTPDQEREWAAQLEDMGVLLVKSEFERGKISPAFVHSTGAWLSAKEKEAEARRDASSSEQIELARRASATAERAASEAERASTAAERSATAAERQATAVERANKRATIAIVIAIVSVIITVAVAIIPFLLK